MKTLLAFLLLLPALAAESTAVRINLGSGRSAVITLADGWEASPSPRPQGESALGTTLHYIPKNGANEAVLITLVAAPEDRMADARILLEWARVTSRDFTRGTVEEEADFKEFRVGGRTGFAARFTDSRLVGKPPVPGDYKTMTCCYIYLGDNVMLIGSIFSDDPSGEGYATARKIMQSLTLSLPQNTI